jgi:hypothetical protein
MSFWVCRCDLDILLHGMLMPSQSVADSLLHLDNYLLLCCSESAVVYGVRCPGMGNVLDQELESKPQDKRDRTVYLIPGLVSSLSFRRIVQAAKLDQLLRRCNSWSGTLWSCLILRCHLAFSKRRSDASKKQNCEHMLRFSLRQVSKHHQNTGLL